MNLSNLAWLNLMQHKGRMVLNVLSIIIAFLLFGLLSALGQIYDNDKKSNQFSSERIIVSNRLTLTKPLPMNYYKDIRKIEGVKAVTRQGWFGGYYKEEKNEFFQYAVDPEQFFEVYPELVSSDDLKETWLRTRNGAMVTKALADRFGWQVGETVPLISKIWPNAESQFVWYFKIIGLLEHKDGSPVQNKMVMSFDFFNESNLYSEGISDEFIVRVENAADINAVGQRIDDFFLEAADSTRSRPQDLFTQQFNKRYDIIRDVVGVILTAVFFTILLITSNSISLSVRERFTEFSVLRVLGFKNGSIFMAVVSEGVILVFLGGMLGLGIAKGLIVGLEPVLASYPLMDGIDIDASTMMQGVALMVGMSLVATIMPAIKVTKANIVDVLRG